jgi:hypothetical protein
MTTGSSACVFCEIVAGRAPAHRVGENDGALAILDISPYARGHTLVLSKRHVPLWYDPDREGSRGCLRPRAPRCEAALPGFRSGVRLVDGARAEDPSHAHLPRPDTARRHARPLLQRPSERAGDFRGAVALAGARIPREGRAPDSPRPLGQAVESGGRRVAKNRSTAPARRWKVIGLTRCSTNPASRLRRKSASIP